MAQGTNIDALSTRNFTKGTDSMVINYDNSKMDQTRDKTALKNVHANPFDCKICPFVDIGVCLVIFEESFEKDRQFLFANEGSDAGSASDKYCKVLKNLFGDKIEEISKHTRPNHANAHET